MFDIAKRLNAFEVEIQPLLARIRNLPPDQQSGLVESLVGAYLGAWHDLHGGGRDDLDRACDRAHRLLNDMVVRQERSVEAAHHKEDETR